MRKVAHSLSATARNAHKLTRNINWKLNITRCNGSTTGSDNITEEEPATIPPTLDTTQPSPTDEVKPTGFGNALKPREIVAELDRHIVGQLEAKKAVANALRNRWRRHQLPDGLREEVMPKNILMIGPTGVGKTEIARRLAKLAQAPFIKVEATKFTEVGFHGRDVDQIIRDLLDISITQTKAKLKEEMKSKAKVVAEEKILDGLVGDSNPATREQFRQMLRNGDLENRVIEIELPDIKPASPKMLSLGGSDNSAQISDILQRFMPGLGSGGGAGSGGQTQTKRRRVKVSECRPIIEDAETEKLVNPDLVIKEAIKAVEQDGIVFIDEIDKICTKSEYRDGHDASSEGVQRDLLPLLEGTTINTKHGNINTEHILFVASGAFHSAKPSDMLAELQGRLPIRVELKGLTRDDLYRILTEPEHNLIKQQMAMLETENVKLEFSEDAIREMANVAAEVNSTVENIGARRLHTILEKILEDISFTAPDRSGEHIVIKGTDVRGQLQHLLQKADLTKFVL